MNKMDLKGRVFGHLEVMERNGNRSEWVCKCGCGAMKVVWHSHLVRGNVKSCGCLRASMGGTGNKRHGQSYLQERNIWRKIKDRCYNDKDPAYEYYGGRGITMCAEWAESFEAFYRDMGSRPGAEFSIDRVDPNGKYEPSNCVWATDHEQANNKRNNVKLTHNGITKNVSQWAKDTGLSNQCIHQRIRLGWPVHKVLAPVRQIS